MNFSLFFALLLLLCIFHCKTQLNSIMSFTSLLCSTWTLHQNFYDEFFLRRFSIKRVCKTEKSTCSLHFINTARSIYTVFFDGINIFFIIIIISLCRLQSFNPWNHLFRTCFVRTKLVICRKAKVCTIYFFPLRVFFLFRQMLLLAVVRKLNFLIFFHSARTNHLVTHFICM